VGACCRGAARHVPVTGQSGQYLIQGKVGILDADPDNQGGSCQLNIGGRKEDIDQVELPVTDDPIAAQTFLPLLATADLTQGGGTVTITCATFAGEAIAPALTALQVGGIN
jgi:hypothetical protein